MSDGVLVVIGVGGMGEAIARRLGAGRSVLLADVDQNTLDRVANDMSGEGFSVTTHAVDVSSRESMIDLTRTATALGTVTNIAHTAGLSPVQAGIEAILRVDLVGVSTMLDAFGAIVAKGGSAVVISSMAGYLSGSLSADQEAALRSTPTEQLLDLPFLRPETIGHPSVAYGIAKRANQIRVQIASTTQWAGRGARVNSISPGIIATAMGRQELDGAAGRVMTSMTDASGCKRLGTPADIAAAAAFLMGPESTFITGADLLVDGGVVAAVNSGALGRPAH